MLRINIGQKNCFDILKQSLPLHFYQLQVYHFDEQSKPSPWKNQTIEHVQYYNLLFQTSIIQLLFLLQYTRVSSSFTNPSWQYYIRELPDSAVVRIDSIKVFARKFTDEETWQSNVKIMRLWKLVAKTTRLKMK